MKFYKLTNEYEGQIKWAYKGLIIQQNVLDDDELDEHSFIPGDSNIQDFEHITTTEVLSHPENWIECNEFGETI